MFKYKEIELRLSNLKFIVNVTTKAGYNIVVFVVYLYSCLNLFWFKYPAYRYLKQKQNPKIYTVT